MEYWLQNKTDEEIVIEAKNNNSLAQEFMTSYSFHAVYYNEYDNLEDFEKKPVRGINLDDDLNESVINLIEIFDKLCEIAADYFKNRKVML